MSNFVKSNSIFGEILNLFLLQILVCVQMCSSARVIFEIINKPVSFYILLFETQVSKVSYSFKNWVHWSETIWPGPLCMPTVAPIVVTKDESIVLLKNILNPMTRGQLMWFSFTRTIVRGRRRKRRERDRPFNPLWVFYWIELIDRVCGVIYMTSRPMRRPV